MEKKCYPAKKQESIAAKIIKKAVKISNTTPHDVFVEYSPHVKWIDVRIFRQGWKMDACGHRMRVGFNWYDDTEEELKELLAALDEFQEDATK